MASLQAMLPAALVGAALAAAPQPNCQGQHCRALAMDADLGGSVSLLQHRGRGAAGAREDPEFAPLDPASQRERLQKALPLAWLHVPKCGSSLVNFIVHLPGVCPGVPDDVIVSSEAYPHEQLKTFRDEYRTVDQDGACQGNIARWGDHHGAGWDEWQFYNGHGILMLRQPEQRAMSGYTCNQHSWPNFFPAASPLEYAQTMQGCATRMIVRGKTHMDETCGGKGGEPITEEEVKLAVERVKTGFAFVGLTEQWALSICLGHRIFGGKCRQSDFIDGRVTTVDSGGSHHHPQTAVLPKTHMYDLAEFKGFADPFDGAVYAAGVEVFRENLGRYNVSYESCRPCFDEAGVDVEH